MQYLSQRAAKKGETQLWQNKNEMRAVQLLPGFFHLFPKVL
jgi:hypothetical protein